MLAFARMPEDQDDARAVQASDPLLGSRVTPPPVTRPATPRGTWTAAGFSGLSALCAVYVSFFQTPYRDRNAAAAAASATASASEAQALKEIREDIAKLRESISAINLGLLDVRKDTTVLQNWTRKHDADFPGGHSAPSVPLPSPSSTAPKSAYVSPPECVHRGTLKKFPCEQVRVGSCLGLSGFTAQRYAAIRKQSGVGEYMLVCDSKDDPPSPAPSASAP